MSMFYGRYIISTPIGEMQAILNTRKIYAFSFLDSLPQLIDKFGNLEEILPSEFPLALELQSQVSDYFLGKRFSFHLPLSLEGTEFQNEIWAKLQTIPYGRTATYAEVASEVNNPMAVRAVGATIGQNPFLILIPCHRILSKAGELTGYQGGITRKSSLLSLEAAFSGNMPLSLF